MIRRVVAALARRLGLRRWWPPRLTAGVGRGLRFFAGASNAAYETGANELPVQRAMAAHLRPGDCFIDVGANVGFFSVIGARLVGREGAVVAFEPVPENAKLVRANAARNRQRQVTVVASAVADREGPGRLILAEYAGGSALDIADTPPDACGELEVELVTLDRWLATNTGHAPNLIKIDVEGAELAALAGMQQTLRRHRPVVIVELDASAAATLADKTAACRAWLARRGYQVRELEASYPNTGWHVAHLLAEPAPAT